MKKLTVLIAAVLLIGAGVGIYLWKGQPSPETFQPELPELQIENISVETTPAPTPYVPPIVTPSPAPKATPVPTATPEHNVNEATPDVVLDPEAGETVEVELTVLPQENKPTPPPTPEPSPVTASDQTPKATVAPKATEPKDGDTRVVDGQKQSWLTGFGWIEVLEGGGQEDMEITITGNLVGTMD